MARMTRANKQAAAIAAERAFTRRLKQVEYLAVSAVSKSAVDVSKQIIERARELVPVDTGYLRASAFVDHPRKTSKGIKLRLGFRAYYATAVETKNPYFEPAVREIMPSLGDHIRRNRQIILSSKPIRMEV